MKLFDVYPIQDIEIQKGRGSYVFDAQGHSYLDLYGGHAVISIGHTHPHYVGRVTEQLNALGFYSNSIQIPIQQQLATQLGKVSGKTDYQLFLCNSGAEANENALKLASFATNRRQIVVFSKAFHGRTSLAVACTDNPKIVAPVNATDAVVFLPFNDIEALETHMQTNGEQVAAVMLETIQGVGGIRVATPTFLQAIRRLTTQYGAVFIADEIQCGYGRTGDFYAQDYSGVQADIYTMAKGMGNGFPVAGISISPAFQPWHGQLGTTFGGNHLACAAALSVLEVMEQEQLLKNAAEVGSYLLAELQQLDKVEEIRGRGLMIGIELPESLKAVRNDLLVKDRIFTGAAAPNVIRLLPALNLTKDQADTFLEVFANRLAQY